MSRASLAKARRCTARAAWIAVALTFLVGGCSDPEPPASTPSAVVEQVDSDRPNLIVVLIDTLRADHLGSYGFAGSVTPHLDRFATESVQFDRCYSSAPWTKPAVATLFTGLDPLVHRVLTHKGHLGDPQDYAKRAKVETDRLRNEFRTIAEILSEAGYTTAAVVSNPWLGRDQGFAQGFDSYDDRWRGNQVDAAKVLTRARQWLERRPRDRPFFLYLHFMDVHSPYDASEADVDAVRKSPGLGPERTLQRSELAPGMLTYLTMPDAAWARTPAFYELREWRARYAGGVHELDRKLGGFLDELRADGMLDRSLVVVTADHGEELFDHLDWGHGKSLYDHQLHVPLLVRNPQGVGGGRRVDTLVALADVMPTLAAVAKAPVPTGILGRDFSPLLRAEASSSGHVAEDGVGHAAVFATGVKWRPKEHSLRTSERKLIVDFATQRAQLFDVVTDPLEKVDRAAVAPEELASWRVRLEQHVSEMQRQAPRSVQPSTELTVETTERLRALGYLDDER